MSAGPTSRAVKADWLSAPVRASIDLVFHLLRACLGGMTILHYYRETNIRTSPPSVLGGTNDWLPSRANRDHRFHRASSVGSRRILCLDHLVQNQRSTEQAPWGRSCGSRTTAEIGTVRDFIPRNLPVAFYDALRLLLLSITLILTFSGCSQPSSPEVVVYVAVDRKDSEPILQRFEKQTGIRVLAVYDAEAAKTTGLVSRLITESARPRCDVFWNNEIIQTLLLKQRGVLAAYDSPSAEDIPSQLKDAAGHWTSVAQRSRVIVYNSELVAQDEIPTSIFDLTDPTWQGKVAIANPQFGTTRSHVAAPFAGIGADRSQEFLRKLLDNDVRIVDGNATVKNLVARAKPNASPILVGLTDTDDVASGNTEGQPIDLVFPDQGEDAIGTLVIPSTVCLIRNAPHAEQAKELIDYLLSPEVEKQFTTDESGYWPIRREHDRNKDVKTMDLSFESILDQLEPSSRWTTEHFHP